MTRTLPKGLFKRGKTYAVRYTIPASLRETVGKREIVRSLGTRNIGEALSLRENALAEIRKSLEPKQIGQGYLCNAKSREPKTTVRATAERWLSGSDGIKNTTRQRYEYILGRFADYTADMEVSEIDRATALAYIESLQNTPSLRTGQPLSRRSVFTHQACLASYWRVLDHWGLVDTNTRNPFSSLLRRLAGQKRTTDPRSKKLRPVTRADAETLLRRISRSNRMKYQFEMYVTVRLMWVTGCRLNEVCSRYLNDLEDHGDHIRIMIPESKTEAGRRTVMIVGEDDCQLLRQAMNRAMVAEPAHPENVGRLFPRIRLGGYDMEPGHYLGKALENARKNLSGTVVTQWDMHSFRRNAVAALVNAGVAREARNLAIGHSNTDDIGMSVYAKEADLNHLIKATFQVLYDELGGPLKPQLDDQEP